jgi:hypothetical protein
MHDYLNKKRRQQGSLGFEEYTISSDVTLCVKDWDEVVDFSLGLKENIPVAQLDAHEVRFGISLPLPQPKGPGTMTIKPQPVDRCSVIIRHREISRPAVINGEIFSPAFPGIPQEHAKILVQCEGFRFTIGPMYKLILTFESDFLDRPRSATAWVNSMRMLLSLALGEAEFEVTPNLRLSPLTFTVREGTEAVQRDRAVELLQICEDLSDLCSWAGSPTELLFYFHDIQKNSLEIRTANVLLDGTAGEVSFDMRLRGENKLPTNLEATFVNSVPFRDHLLVCYGKAMQIAAQQIESGRFACRSKQIAPGGIRFLRRLPGEFDTFVERLKIATDANIVVTIGITE